VLLAIKDFFNGMGAGITPAFLVFMFAKPPLQIGGDAGINTIIGALEEVEEVHGLSLISISFHYRTKQDYG
jgi:hypothetical protein